MKTVEQNPLKFYVTREDDTSIEAIVVLDATAHSRRLVKKNEPFDTCYQIAYGIVAEVYISSLQKHFWFFKCYFSMGIRFV